jgi:hypothetical protein
MLVFDDTTIYIFVKNSFIKHEVPTAVSFLKRKEKINQKGWRSHRNDIHRIQTLLPRLRYLAVPSRTVQFLPR